MNMVRICHISHRLHEVDKYRRPYPFRKVNCMDNRMAYNPENRNNLMKPFKKATFRKSSYFRVKIFALPVLQASHCRPMIFGLH